VPERLVSTNVRLAIALVVVFAMILGAMAGSYILSLHALAQSQRNWCSTLKLLTSNPAQPKTASGRVFYAQLHELERRFGC